MFSKANDQLTGEEILLISLCHAAADIIKTDEADELKKALEEPTKRVTIKPNRVEYN